MSRPIKHLQLLTMILVIMAMYCNVRAQNIIRFEYFFDTDPGMGLGTQVVVSPTVQVTNLSIAVATSSLTAGFHTLYIRSKNDLNQWTQTQFRNLYVVPALPVPNNITRIEYFIDTDPGIGLATVAPGLTPATTLANFPIDISAAPLSLGIHTFYVRSKTTTGQWTETYTGTFNVVTTVSPPSITSFSPASGIAGTSVTITGSNFSTIPANNLVKFNGVTATVTASSGTSITTTVPPGATSTGTISVTVAGLTATSSSNFTINAPQISSAEYFYDSDPGPGNGAPISITPATAININNLNLPSTSLSIGWHTLCVRTKDSNNSWGFYETRSIYVRDPLTPVVPAVSPVSAMEYFYDNVTAPGSGIPVTITTGNNVDVPGVSLPSTLAPGWHSLHVRTKNQNNVWGFYETRSILVRGAAVGPPPAPAPITSMEYFYDNVTDPGTGQSISVTTGTLVDIPNSNLPSTLVPGWHSVHVRSKDQNNVWGFYETRSVFVRNAAPIVSPPAPIVLFEYFVDNDPGVGLSTLTLTKPPSTLIDLPAEALPVGPLSLGSHIIGFRAKDQNGVWSPAEQRSFTVTTGCSAMTAPTTTSMTRCTPGTLTLTASGGTGAQVYRWYADNISLVVLFTGSSFITPSLSANTDYYASIYDPSTFCESLRTKASAIVSGIPKPTLNLTGSLTVCQGNSVTLQAPVGFSSYAWSNGLATQQITVATGGSYSVIVGNGTCLSSSSDPFTFAVNPNPAKPIITATGGGSLCGTGSVTLSAPSGFSNYSWSSGQSTQNIVVSSVGNFTVAVTNSNGCQSVPSDVFSVTSSSLPKPTITLTGGSIICGSGTVQLSAPAGYSSYSWSDGSTGQTDNVGSGTYTLTVTSGSCVSVASDAVVITTVSTSPKPTITVTGSTSLCNGAFAVLSAPSGFSNYVWSDGEITRQIVVNTSNAFSVQVGHAANCLSVVSDPVITTLTGASCGASNVPGSPIVSNGSRCGAGTVSLSAGGATGNQTYKWYDVPSGTLLFTGSTFVTPSISTTTNYYVTIFDSTNGESNPTKATGTVVNLATPTLPGQSSLALCSGSSTLLSAPNGFISYLWSNGATTQDVQIDAAGTYSVQVGDGICLSAASNSITVSVSPALDQPIVSVTGNTTLCGNDSVQLNAPSGAGLTYAWSDSETTQGIVVNSAGSFSVTISNGVCTSPSSDMIKVDVVSVLSKPDITITGSAALCNGAFAVLSAPVSNNYLWSTGETTRQIVVNTADKYTLQVGNASNCLSIASDSIVITLTGLSCGTTSIPGSPSVTSRTRCGTGTVTLSASGATGTQTYNWYNSPSGPLLFSGSDFATPSISDTTYYYVTILDPTNGESNPTKATAAVVNLTAPTIAGQSTLVVCSGSSTFLSASGGYSSYSWSNGATTQQIQVTDSGSYSVQGGNSSCTSPSSNVIAVSVSAAPTKPAIKITGSATFCSDGSVDLSAPDGFIYQWSNGATTQEITVSETTVITLVVLNSDGCSSPVSDPVAVTKLLPPCKPNTAPVIASIPISVKIEGSVTIDLTKYISDAEDNIDYSRLQLLSQTTAKGASAFIDGAYNLTIDYKGVPFSGTDRITLEVYDLFNLSAQRVLDIDVVGEVVVFNGITPDGDGKNDFFYIKYLDVIQGGLNNKVTIFNRWGDVVFNIDDYNNIDRVFAGSNNHGSPLPSGTYFYRIDLSGVKPVTGFITLKN